AGAMHPVAVADVATPARETGSDRPEVVGAVGQEVAHAILGASRVRAGVDVAFGCDRDVPLPASTADHVRLRVVEQPQRGPFPAQGRVDVQTYGRAARGEGAHALGC